MTLLHDQLANLPAADETARAAVHDRAADILRPSGALAWLDEIAAWVAGWQRTDRPAVRRPAGLIFAADHGVAAATKVSAYPTGVTEAMLAAYREGRSTINAFARIAGAEVTAIDVGVGHPTGDIRFESALTERRFELVVQTAIDAVGKLDCDLLVLGEMGIGNTTPSAAIAAALAGGETAAWVGRGTGVDDEGLARKRAAVQESVRRIAGITDPIEILREVGGAELVAVAAATIAARHRSIPVVLDGYVVTAAVLPLFSADNDRTRPLHRRALLGRTGSPPVARTVGQTTAARPRHATRRGVGRDGGGAVDRDGLRGRHRGADVCGVVRRVTRRTGRAGSPLGNALGAAQFLTRVPIRLGTPPTIAACVPWFPLIGALIGLVVGGVAAGLMEVVPASVAAVVAVLAGVMITGAFHEDGLADTADAMGGWTPEQRRQILKDSRHGSYGVAALCGSIVLRVVCVASMGPAVAFGGLVAAHTLGPRLGSRHHDGLDATAGSGARR